MKWSSAPKRVIVCVRLPWYSIRWNSWTHMPAYAICGTRATASASVRLRTGRIRTSYGRLSGLTGELEK